jgi:hypothetical protein
VSALPEFRIKPPAEPAAAPVDKPVPQPGSAAPAA